MNQLTAFPKSIFGHTSNSGGPTSPSGAGGAASSALSLGLDDGTASPAASLLASEVAPRRFDSGIRFADRGLEDSRHLGRILPLGKHIERLLFCLDIIQSDLDVFSPCDSRSQGASAAPPPASDVSRSEGEISLLSIAADGGKD